MNNDKIKGVAKFVNGNSNVLCEISARKKVVELNSFWVEKINNIYVKVTGDEELLWDGSGIGRKEENLF